ncbi:MAG: hypothetical protein ABFD21_01770 [Anaerolineaceae bacterium]
MVTLLIFGISYVIYLKVSNLPKDLAQSASGLFSLGLIFAANTIGKLFDSIGNNEPFWPSYFLVILFAALSVLCFWGLDKLKKDFQAKYLPDSQQSVSSEK